MKGNVAVVTGGAGFIGSYSDMRRDPGREPEVTWEKGVRMLAGIESWLDAPLWDPDPIAEATPTWFTFLGRA